MAPLDDITIYDTFNELKFSEEELKVFGKEKMFICELFHHSMNSYKPPHTARICLNIALEEQPPFPSYFGSICHSSHYFDRDKFILLDKKERYQYLLEYVFSSTIKLADELKWDKEVFTDAYNNVKETGFAFRKEFPEKLSRDRKKKGQAVLVKTEDSSILTLSIVGADFDEKIVLFDKINSYPLDISNRIAKQCKWIDNEKFGYQDTKTKATIHYNLETKKRFRNFKFWEETYEPLKT